DVTRPGTYTVTSDKITIFQAIALASDLTVYGQRDNIKVVREQNGKRQVFVLDLRDSNVFNSPAYYLQQNDVVYVTPNEVRAGQSTINENYFKSGSFWISVGSIAITVTNLIITILRK
ncbi:MAG: polysaccharide export protein, partial [Bacteroidales bacterium]|nr:polysaccharide export protein [Bacteroidales bacterium]